MSLLSVFVYRVAIPRIVEYSVLTIARPARPRLGLTTPMFQGLLRRKLCKYIICCTNSTHYTECNRAPLFETRREHKGLPHPGVTCYIYVTAVANVVAIYSLSARRDSTKGLDPREIHCWHSKIARICIRSNGKIWSRMQVKDAKGWETLPLQKHRSRHSFSKL